MGGSASAEQKVSNEQREVENEAASLGSLPMLHNSFSKLADPSTNSIPLQSLQRCFSLDCKDAVFDSEEVVKAKVLVEPFMKLLICVGPSIVDLFFVGDKDGIGWIEFVRGYLGCCGRMSVSVSLNGLLRVFALAAERSGISLKLEVESSYGGGGGGGGGDGGGGGISGSMSPIDALMLLWMCWSIVWDSKGSSCLEGSGSLCLPNVNHLVLSMVVSCANEAGISSGLDPWDCDVNGLDVRLPVEKFLTWVPSKLPGLTECFSQFINARLKNSASMGVESTLSSLQVKNSPKEMQNPCLLTCGRAWAISLACRTAIKLEVIKPFLPNDSNVEDKSLLYRSSLHGRGLNRFWSKVEGYHGPLLILVCAASEDTQGNSTNDRRWIIGAVTEEGFENRDVFYGSSGCLYAISPIFHVFSATDKEKNFLYTHLHPTGRVYQPRPKPVGIAFGGSVGNERIFIDEDFAKVTVRHHVVDKTYQSGSLLPNQGFLPVEALVSEVEVWGLGGKTSKDVQASYKKREELFIEQRRKVDLKTFANWDDSPEKMMMDMMSDPNAVRKEDR